MLSTVYSLFTIESYICTNHKCFYFVGSHFRLYVRFPDRNIYKTSCSKQDYLLRNILSAY